MIAEVITKKLKKHCRPRTLQTLAQDGIFVRKAQNRPASPPPKGRRSSYSSTNNRSGKSLQRVTVLAQDKAGVQLRACDRYGWRFRADRCKAGIRFPHTKETRIIGALGHDGPCKGS